LIEKLLNLDKKIAVFAKDKNLKYLFVNEAGAELAGLDSPNQIAGKTDYDFVWKPQATLYRHGDAQVMTGAIFVNKQEPRTQCNGMANVLHTKTILRDRNEKVIGIAGTAIELTGYSVTKNHGYLDPIKNIFYLGPEFSNEHFTQREFEIFKYILLGKQVGEIALALSRSSKTIESHIKSIVNKLQCRHKSEIVPTAIKFGLTYVLENISIIENTKN